LTCVRFWVALIYDSTQCFDKVAVFKLRAVNNSSYTMAPIA
jgi:chloramphenicol O-acetyltransferase